MQAPLPALLPPGRVRSGGGMPGQRDRPLPVQAHEEDGAVPQRVQAARSRLQRDLSPAKRDRAQGKAANAHYFPFRPKDLFTTVFDGRIAWRPFCSLPSNEHAKYELISFETQQKEEKERAAREEEERKNRIELEQFQRKFDRKRNKDRRRIENEPETPSRPLHLYIVAVVGLAVALVSGALWMRS